MPDPIARLDPKVTFEAAEAVASAERTIHSMSVEEARDTLLATGVAGVELPAGNGAPCRLVVPNRRGLDWVKWVSEIIVVG